LRRTRAQYEIAPSKSGWRRHQAEDRAVKAARDRAPRSLHPDRVSGSVWASLVGPHDRGLVPRQRARKTRNVQCRAFSGLGWPGQPIRL